jgi:hypothetical protein
MAGKRTKTFWIVTTLASAAFITYLVSIVVGHRTAEGYRLLLQDGGHISHISVTGPGISRDITEPLILKDFESAFENSKATGGSNGPMTGVHFFTNFTLADTRNEVKTYVYLYDDGSGFALADQSRTSADDPLFVDIRFPRRVSQQTKSLVDALLAWAGKVRNE